MLVRKTGMWHFFLFGQTLEKKKSGCPNKKKNGIKKMISWIPFRVFLIRKELVHKIASLKTRLSLGQSVLGPNKS